MKTTYTLKGLEFEIKNNLFETTYKIEIAFNTIYSRFQLITTINGLKQKTGETFATIEKAIERFEESKASLNRQCESFN